MEQQRRPGGIIPLSSLLQETTIATPPLGPAQGILPDNHPLISPTRREYFDPARDLGLRSNSSIDGSTQSRSMEDRPSANDVRPNRLQLRIVQQPVAARACGHGERDRRVVDPPPILQLTLAGFDPASASDREELQHAHNVVHCKLYTTTARSRDVSTIADPNDPQKVIRSLMGTHSSTPFNGVDPNLPAWWPAEQKLGVFYIFHDLSCRHTGRYRLYFELASLSTDVGITRSVVASATSHDFEVFSAKDFPGMQPSSALSRELKRQGANLPIKKGAETRERRRSMQAERDESEESPGEGGSQG